LVEPSIEFSLVEGGRVKLLVEPFVQAHCAHSFEIALPRTKCESIEGMEDAFVALQLV
jgi:hypothetical protein